MNNTLTPEPCGEEEAPENKRNRKLAMIAIADANAKEVIRKLEEENPVENLSNGTLNQEAFDIAWKSWIHFTDKMKYDRDACLRRAIEAYFIALPSEIRLPSDTELVDIMLKGARLSLEKTSNRQNMHGALKVLASYLRQPKREIREVKCPDCHRPFNVGPKDIICKDCSMRLQNSVLIKDKESK